MTTEAFETALSRLMDGELSSEEFAVIEQYLVESREARAQYREFVDLHNVLELELDHSTVVQPGASGVVPIDRIIARQQSRTLRWSAGAAAALFILMGVIFKLVLVSDPEPILSFRAAKDSILSVSHSSTAEKTPAPGTLDKGSRLQLTQGTIELTLATGVVSIVQAPADLTLHSDDRLYIDHGVAWFHVPSGAEGFQVQTPDVLVTDFGTEFGVVSNETALDEVHLFSGKVEVRNRNGMKNSELLSAPSARIVGPAGRLKSTTVRPSDFLTSLPAGPPHVYFSFDTIEDDLMDVKGSHRDVPGITARYMKAPGDSSSASLVPGRLGQALHLSGRGDYVLTDWPGISGKRARTVACWVRMPEGTESNPAAAIAGWGYLRNFGKWKIHVAPNDTGEGRFARISLGSIWHSADQTRLDDGKWHHVVAVSYARTLEDGLPDLAIFIDGRKEVISGHSNGSPRDLLREVDTITYAQDSVPLLVGKGMPAPIMESFRGEIDELYIFEGALTDESISELANPINR